MRIEAIMICLVFAYVSSQSMASRFYLRGSSTLLMAKGMDASQNYKNEATIVDEYSLY